MTITRVAAILILLSQAVLLVLVFDLSGRSAILFSFVGHPLIGLGLLLAVIRLIQRDREAAAASNEIGPS